MHRDNPEEQMVSTNDAQLLPDIKTSRNNSVLDYRTSGRKHSDNWRSAHTTNPSFVSRKKSIEQSAHSLRTVNYSGVRSYQQKQKLANDKRSNEASILKLEQPIEINFQAPKGASTSKVNRDSLKEKIIAESSRFKKTKKRTALLRDSPSRSKFMTQLPSQDHKKMHPSSSHQSQDYIDQTQNTPQLSRVRKGSSHRRTQARQHIISEPLKNSANANTSDEDLFGKADHEKMNSTIAEIEESVAPEASTIYQIKEEA